MTWLYVLAPLFVSGLIFLAYLGGKKAGRKEAELEQIKKEKGASDNVDAIISNNQYVNDADFITWLSKHTKK